MSISYTQTHSLTCPQCGNTFEVQIWLIVDAAERPDLLERVKDGSLHTVPCPACHAQGSVDMPLLLYFPHGLGLETDAGQSVAARLLFSPAQRTAEEEDRRQANELLGRLSASLGGGWQEAWAKDGLRSVPRPLLPAVLSENPQAELRRMAEQSAL